ncbi:MAG: hypothetical protein ACRDDE_12030 [Paraclostridium sp.]|uniref:hypothetical protein n=1 Tax=Paraclostridium sp. TaxID=2023273 RepID=UPI003EE725A7
MNYDFKKAYEYAHSVDIEDLAKRATVYNAYITQYYYDQRGAVAHDVMLTIIGSIYGPYGDIDQDGIDEIDKYLKFTNQGFTGGWGTMTFEWFSKKFKTQQDADYFNNMAQVLMDKSNSVYELLCSTSSINIDKLIGGRSPFEGFDSNPYVNWKYI